MCEIGRLWLAVRKSAMGGHYWRYECDTCKEDFTTDESDELSMSTLRYMSNLDHARLLIKSREQ